MSQQISRNRNSRSKISKNEMLMKEMQKREQACLSKLQKLSDRINILEKFQNQPSAKNVDLKEYLKAKGIDIGRYFAPMGYFTPNNMVVSNDGENDYLKYHKGMNFNKNVGYHIPERGIVSEEDHKEITSSIYGMTWNPALMHYYPTTAFDTTAYSDAEGIGDTGMDMIGGLRINDFCGLNNTSEDAKELTSMVQGLLEEEFDNVEGELDLIQDAQRQLYGGDLSFEGVTAEAGVVGEVVDTRKTESGKNLLCRSKCAFKGKDKRQACENECDKKFKSSGKQETRRGEREERKEAKDEFRADKKSCKQKLASGEFQKWQYKECLKTEKKDKRSDIKEAGGNLGKRIWRTTAVVNPILATARGGVLLLVKDNAWGFATRLAPALLPDAQAKELFKPEAIEKAKTGWKKVANGYRNMGGDAEKLKSKVIEGYKKKPYKIARKSSFEGDYYEFEEYSNFEPYTIITAIGAVSAGLGALASLVSSFTKSGGEKNPYKEGQTPPDYQNALNDGTIETNPPLDGKAPVLNDKGEWTEQSTGKVIDPITGKYKDTIFGLNKWLAIGIGVAGVVGLYYIFKGQKK
jgi:hypothetical protein